MAFCQVGLLFLYSKIRYFNNYFNARLFLPL